MGSATYGRGSTTQIMDSESTAIYLRKQKEQSELRRVSSGRLRSIDDAVLDPNAETEKISESTTTIIRYRKIDIDIKALTQTGRELAHFRGLLRRKEISTRLYILKRREFTAAVTQYRQTLKELMRGDERIDAPSVEEVLKQCNPNYHPEDDLEKDARYVSSL